MSPHYKFATNVGYLDLTDAALEKHHIKRFAALLLSAASDPSVMRRLTVALSSSHPCFGSAYMQSLTGSPRVLR